MKSCHFVIMGLFLLMLYIGNSKPIQLDTWGFYAHKLINRMAIFTLPDKLIEFYKANLDYISNHAVDPDKRRYALKKEAIRHYLDLDHWTQQSPVKMPEDFITAQLTLNHFFLENGSHRMLLFDTIASHQTNKDSLYFSTELIQNKINIDCAISIKELRKVFKDILCNGCYLKDGKISNEQLFELFPFLDKDDLIEMNDRISPHGILPYHLEHTYYQLIEAFKTKSISRILRLSADIGHYVGDAHVPLHTSENYNGQMTNQEGIHAFWESRIPELFAESEFDFVVGPAVYIADIRSFIWKIIEDSHSGLTLVFNMERTLRQQTAPDQQYCYDERLGAITKIQCREYAKKYNQLLDYQVEDRMRSSILDLGSLWMSAWVEAGQPDLISHPEMNPVDKESKSDSISTEDKPLIQIRDHE